MSIRNEVYYHKEEQFSDLNPLFIGEEKCKPSHSYGPRICPYTIIHYVISGCGTLDCEGRHYTVSEGQFFIIFSGEKAKYKADSTNPWNYLWVSFDGKYMNKLMELNNNVFDGAKEIFQALVSEFRYGSCNKFYIVSLLYNLYSLLSAQASVNKKSNYAEEVKKILNLRFMESISVEDIAKSLNIDKRYMSRLFKKSFGKTVISYLIEIRMRKACDLLNEGYSVSDTASIVGYNDSFNFSKMFKKTNGISPMEYKKKFINSRERVEVENA